MPKTNRLMALANEFVNLAIEELVETDQDVTPENHYLVLHGWVEVYEDVPPKNRLDRAVFDALVEARDRIALKVRPTIAS